MRWRLRHGIALYAFTCHVACGYVGVETLGGEGQALVDPQATGMGGELAPGDGDEGAGAVDGSGGEASTGGGGASGGNSNSGGSQPRGATGGMSSGGSMQTGGMSSGGAMQTGGTSSGGEMNSGGTVGAGGSVSSGGAIGMGGMMAAGGTPSSGGATSSGGTVSSGGAMSAGGSGSGGSPPVDCGADAETCWRRPQCDYRMRLVFNNTGQGPLSDFPVLVQLDLGRFNYMLSNESGFDLEFVDAFSDATLAHEVEHWNSAGTSSIWVSIPRIEGNSTTDHFWMYFGCLAGPDADAPSVWDPVYDGVWHLDASFSDSTSAENHGTNVGSIAVPGIGPAREVTGTGQRVEIPSSTEGVQAASVSIWMRLNTLDAVSGSNVLFAFGGPTEDSTDNHLYTLNLEPDRKLHMFWEHSDGEDVNSTFSSSSTALSDNGWHHYAFVRDEDPQSLWFYFDGRLLGNMVSYGLNPNGGENSELWIGASPESPGTFNLDGGVDELRITSELLSADWIRAEYLTGSDQFLHYGSIEAAP